MQEKVPLKENEELMVNKGAFTKHWLARIRKEVSVQTPQGLASTSSTPMFSTADTLSSRMPFQLQALAYLNRMEKNDCDMMD